MKEEEKQKKSETKKDPEKKWNHRSIFTTTRGEEVVLKQQSSFKDLDLRQRNVRYFSFETIFMYFMLSKNLSENIDNLTFLSSSLDHIARWTHEAIDVHSTCFYEALSAS